MHWALAATMRYLAFLGRLRREISTDQNFQDAYRPLPLSELTLKLMHPPAATLGRQFLCRARHSGSYTIEDIVIPARRECLCH